jgi:hypothetical protein
MSRMFDFVHGRQTCHHLNQLTLGLRFPPQNDTNSHLLEVMSTFDSLDIIPTLIPIASWKFSAIPTGLAWIIEQCSPETPPLTDVFIGRPQSFTPNFSLHQLRL